MKIGCIAPRLRLPAFVNGELSYHNLEHFKGRWTCFCFVQRCDYIEALFLNQQAKRFAEINATLVGVITQHALLYKRWVRMSDAYELPLLADPFRKARRVFRLPYVWDEAMCHTIVMDEQRVIRSRLLHSLNGRGMSSVLETLKQYMDETREKCRSECTVTEHERAEPEHSQSSHTSSAVCTPV